MRRGLGVLTAAAVLAVAAAPPALATGPLRSPGTSPAAESLTFIEALAAIPEASRALARAQATVAEARDRRVRAGAAAIAADARLSRANADLRDARLALLHAERSVASAQDAIDDAVRTMYASGGTSPSLAEVMLTADSELGLTRSLVTRQYLMAAGTDVVRTRARAEVMAAEVAAAVERVVGRRSVAAAAAVVADTSATQAVGHLDEAQQVAERARARYRDLMRRTRADRSADYGRVKVCGDWLTRLLARTGFSGEDLREAWAIVMRESGGREDAVSVTNDLGLFQINTATWRKQPWFDRKALLTRVYNAKVAHQLSRGGRSWYSWGLDGHGRPDPGAYVKSGWSADRIMDAIVVPYIQWYAQYPCRPAGEPDLGLGIAPPRAEQGDPALQEGAGFVPSADGRVATDAPGGPAAP